MILCICQNITEFEAAQMSAEEFKAGMQCGKCLEEFERMGNAD